MDDSDSDDEVYRVTEYVPPEGHSFERFTEEMKVFEEDFKDWRKRFEERLKKAEKQQMKFEWMDNWGNRLKGVYEGEVEEGVPHGIGLFTTETPKTLKGATTQGTWEKGVMQGYAMAENDRCFNYYINVDGRIHGKFIVHRKCGGFFHRQWVNREGGGQMGKKEG